MRHLVFRCLSGLTLIAVCCNEAASLEAPASPTTQKYLDRRKQRQTLAAEHYSVFAGFQFTNTVLESGITFENKVVEDAGKNYKAAHYDHGNGVAAADVDGDGLIDLYFTTQLGENGLWRNLGGGKFENITSKAGVGMEDQISVAAAFADVDNDGRPDLFVTTIRHGNRLFKNLGDGRFQDVTPDSGLGYNGHSSAAVFFDFDNDGLLDLYLCNVGVYTTSQKGPGGYYLAYTDAFAGHTFKERSESGVLYHNLGGFRFKDASDEMKLHDASWSGEATAVDLNEDGFPDLYLANMQGDDHYYENQAGKGFIEKTPAYFPKTSWGAMMAKFFDYNRDGKLDLFVTDMHSDMTGQQTQDAMDFNPAAEGRKSEQYCSLQWTEAYLQGSSNNIFGNSFYKNEGAGRFTESSDSLGVETYWPWGCSVGDVNADGFDDLFITAGMGYPFRYAINSLLLNESGNRFVEAEFLTGIEPRSGGILGKVWFTLDCSGIDKANSLCAGKEGQIPIYGSLSSRSSVILDLDNDGDLDIVILDFNGRPQILVNNLAQKRPVKFIKVALTGTKSNRQGLGARVILRAGKQNWTQVSDGKSGYFGQSAIPLYFGLGEVERIESLEVIWPSGAKQAIQSPGVNQLVNVKEP